MKYVKTFESWLKNIFKTDNDSIESFNSRTDYGGFLNRWDDLNINESRNPPGHWTKERCQEEALKYNSRSEFKKNSSRGYTVSRKNGWLDEICSHMVELQKPSGHWTKERCQEEALKYNSRTEFSKNSVRGYEVSRKNGWLDEICSHMVELHKPSGHWTKERCQEEALKYNSRSEFKKNSVSAYDASHRNGWLDEICSHMVELQKPSGHWTKERCQEEALKYNSRSEFQRNSVSAYNSSRKNGWFDEICSHMDELQKPVYWTKEKCQEDALKYNSRSEFKKNSGSAYNSSLKNGWLDEICSHMLPQGSLKKRYIYSYEFSDKSVYIGLTWNIENRKRRHIEDVRSAVNKYIKNNPHLSYEFKEWGYYDMLDTGKMEGEKEKEYIDSGWNILNVVKTGGLGGMTLKWTKEKCQEEALKYNSRIEFQRNSPAYKASWKNGWLDEICSHMDELRKPSGHWTKERCQEEALKYNSRSEFQKNSPAYKASLRNGWLDEICNHMVELQKPSGHWTKERCQEEALKYNSRSDFQKNSGSAYVVSRKNGWLDEICGHMVELQKPSGHWTKERCQEEALKYNSRSDFQKNSPGAHNRSHRNRWLDEICSHMKSK